jgi:hypothetical protein
MAVTVKIAVFRNTELSKSLFAPDDYGTKNKQKYFKQLQLLTMIT